MRYQPERRGASWSKTIVVQRKGIPKLLTNREPKLPVCRPRLRLFLAVLKRPKNAFPAVCPYTLEQLLDEEFLPQPASNSGAL